MSRSKNKDDERLPKPENKLFAAKLRRAREAAELTLQELADRAGTYKSCVSDWEHGIRAPSLRQLRDLARGLRVSISELAA